MDLRGNGVSEYKRLLVQIADSLDAEDVRKIVFLYELPNRMNQSPPLFVLEHVHQMGGSKFNERNLTPLITLLKDISKEELISSKVEPYRQSRTGGRPPSNSLPYNAVNPRIPTGKRPSSYYGQTLGSYSFSSVPCQETASPVTNNLPSLSSSATATSEHHHQETITSINNSSALNMQSLEHIQEGFAPTDTISTCNESKLSSHPDQRSLLFNQPTEGRGAHPPLSRSATYNHFSTQSLPLHASNNYNNPRQRHSLPYTGIEASQHLRNNQGQYFPQQRTLLHNSQNVALFSPRPGPLPINEGAMYYELRPMHTSPHWYAGSATSSVDNIDHHTSYSSGFASSGEIYPPRSSSRQSGSTGVPSFSMNGHHSYQPTHRQIHQQPTLEQQYSSEKRQAHAEVHAADQLSFAPLQSTVHSPADNIHHLSNPNKAENLSISGTTIDNSVPATISKREPEVMLKTCSSSRLGVKEEALDTGLVKHSPVSKRKHDFEKRMNVSSLGEVSNILPELQTRTRSHSFDQKPGEKPRYKKTGRLSLHLDQASSDGTLTPQASSYRHSFHSVLDTSPVDEKPALESSIVIKGTQESSHIVSRIPKSYRPLFLTRLQTKTLREELEWKEKINDVNKLIYDHKQIGKFLPCPWKIAIEGKDELPGLKIVVYLHPYGLEEDENEYVTVEVIIEQPKKLRLPSEAKLSIKLLAKSDKTKRQLGNKETIADVNLSYFYMKSFISHERLRESLKLYGNENVIVTIKGKMILQTAV